MNIGTLADKAGVPPKTIRYYESIGLVPSAERRLNGYRTYSDVDVHTLQFIKRARSLGFSVDEVRDLLDLWRDRSRTSARVKALAVGHLNALARKIAELTAMRRTLADLVERCHGDERPECPILDDLGNVGSPAGTGHGNGRTIPRSAYASGD
jgi:MerR family transcriptional regulator, copper efflux regulator